MLSVSQYGLTKEPPFCILAGYILKIKVDHSMKRYVALITALCLFFCAAVIPAQAAELDPESGDLANSWRYEDGEPVRDPFAAAPIADAYHPDATLKGIDVSHHQGQINWEKVRDAGIDFAILRVGFGMDQTDQDDLCFAYNASECERLGIPYGVYIYSYATDVERAASEAEHVLRLIQGRTLSFPVYFDMEDESTEESDLAAIAKTFCAKISAAGYPVGVYANAYWWNTFLTDPCFDNWHRWVAHYNMECGYTGKYAMWQYTSSGTVDGVEGDVDMNYLIGYPADHGNCAVRHICRQSVVAPTCTQQGYTVYTCVHCGQSYADNYVEPIPHGYGAWQTVKEATCLEKGAEIRICACGASESRETGIGDHSYADGFCIYCGDEEPPFADTVKGNYYYEPVLWAVEQGITTGLSENLFGVDETCTRAQFVTFLWRSAGSPSPGTQSHSFADVEGGQFYSDAVLWAVEQGITTGLNESTFGINDPCSRAQAVTFLHRYAGTPEPSISDNPFADAQGGQFYSNPILWAVENGITTGLNENTFGINDPCSRAQVVTFLYRAAA